MSTKYGDRTASKYVDDDVAMTDHALFRYRQRTPQDCDLNPRLAWERGEDVKHPAVCQSDGHDRPPQRVRVYRHSDDWGIAFLVDWDQAGGNYGAPMVVVTVMSIQNVEHGPSKAYLHSHGPHGGEQA